MEGSRESTVDPGRALWIQRETLLDPRLRAKKSLLQRFFREDPGRALWIQGEEESWSERKRKRAGAKGEEERERKWGKKEGNNTRAKRRERGK